MEKVLVVALESYGNTFVEPKEELGARFGHLVCEYQNFFATFRYTDEIFLQYGS